ncbi:MAG: ankyrin repeat domain-containing protein [Legionella sp.]|nr:ankyrin repeat domain-containing protein [Legionella sp.]
MLIWASAYGNLIIVQYLISKHVDLHIDLNAITYCPGHSAHGMTALHWAYGRGYYDIVHAILLKVPMLMHQHLRS